KLWDALMDSVAALDGQSGRRVVVVFSDGDDRGSATQPMQVTLRANLLDVMIYALATWTVDPETRRQVAPSERLKALAEDTGGGFLELHEYDEMNRTFTQVLEELHTQYLVGFTPA